MAGKRNLFTLATTLTAVDRFSGPLSKLKSGIGGLRSPVASVQGKLGGLGKAAGFPMLLSGFAAVGHGVLMAGQQVAVFFRRLMLGAAAGGAAIFGLTYSFAKSGDNLAKTAKRLGFTVEELQEYRFAAERNGIEARTFDMAMQRMGRRVAEAARGTGEGRVALEMLGISSRDTEGKVRTLADLLPEVADKLGRLENASVRNSLAMKLFDSEGVALVQMLGGGAKGLEELRVQFRRLGGTISTEAAGASEEFLDRMLDLRVAASGFRNIIAESALPTLTLMIRDLTGFLASRGPAVRAWFEGIGETVHGFFLRLREGWNIARTPLAIASRGVLKFFDSIGTRKAALLVVKGVLFTLAGAAVLLGGAFAGLVLAVRAASWAFKAHLAILEFLLKPVRMLWTGMVWLKDKTVWVFGRLRAAWNGFLDYALGWGRRLRDEAGGALEGFREWTGFFGRLFEGIRWGASMARSAIADLKKEASLEGVGKWATRLAGGPAAWLAEAAAPRVRSALGLESEPSGGIRVPTGSTAKRLGPGGRSRLEIDLRTAPGVRADVRRLDSDDDDLELSVMQGIGLGALP